MDNLQHNSLPTGTFGYSAINLDDENIGATEYTLVTIVVDESYSVTDYQSEMEKCLQEIIKSCNRSPRKDNLMIRVMTFHSQLREIHGFKLLSDCHDSDYNNCINPSGRTALYDAAHNAIEATIDYGKQLSDNDFDVNSIIIIITDGADNESRNSVPVDIKNTLQQAIKDEYMESLMTILIGISDSDYDLQELENLQSEAGLSQFIKIKEANANSLAKLANFVSQSISAQSQALGTGASSQSIVIDYNYFNSNK